MKLQPDKLRQAWTCVAPHAGAWIETWSYGYNNRLRNESHPTRVRGLKRIRGYWCWRTHVVAPHAGAWIETVSGLTTFTITRASHPTRVRGLKRRLCHTGHKQSAVAPHAGAWIETVFGQVHVSNPRVAPHAGAWIEMGRLERSCKPACHDAPLRIHDLKLPAKEYPKSWPKTKKPSRSFP